MDKFIIYPVQLIVVVAIFLIVIIHIKAFIKAIISFGGRLPKWLSWLRKGSKFLSRPDFLSCYQIVFLIFICLEKSPWRIAIYFAIAALLDGLDGLMARLFPETKSSVGELLDSSVDKIVVTGTAIRCWIIIGFSDLNKILIMVMIGMDVLRALLFVIQYSLSKYGMLLSWKAATNYWGKIKRTLQAASLIIYLLRPEYNSQLLSILLVPTIFCGMMSNIGHIVPNQQWYRIITAWVSKPMRKIYRSEQA